MPKSLKVHNNERIDIPDFDLAASGFTRNSMKYFLEQAVIDEKSRVFGGFRVEVADQTSFPGQITIRNGNFTDLDGQMVSIEDQPDASLTITLTGASQTFYVEVEYTESESDVDGRGFWDSTIENTAPQVNGGEVNINASTRNTPSWRIVTPVSTTGFTRDTTPNTLRVPVCIVSTDGSNEITAAVNQFTALENASAITTYDAAATDTTVRVADSTLIPVGATITVGFGGTAPDAALTVSANNMERGILTFAPALANSHLAGSIVRVTGVSATYLPEETDPNAAAYDEALAVNRPNDYRERMWGGDEIRGSGLLQSKQTFGGRDDLDLQNLKDQLDYQAAVLREMKFGSPRSDVTSAAPPNTFSTTPRYYDNAGSVQGARSVSVSIGNGTTTFGDFNGTDDVPFQAAVNYIAAIGNGTIFIKKGTYTFTNTVNIPVGMEVEFIGEDRNTVNLVANTGAATPGCFDIQSAAFAGTILRNITFSFTGTTTNFCEVTVNNGYLRVYNCTGVGIISSATNAKFHVEDSTLTAGVQATGNIIDSTFRNCDFAYSIVTTTGFLRNSTFDGCRVTFPAPGAIACISATSEMSDCHIVDCTFEDFTGFATVPQISVGAITDSLIQDCHFRSSDYDCSAAFYNGIFITTSSTVDGLTVRDCVMEITSPNNVTASNSAGCVAFGQHDVKAFFENVRAPLPATDESFFIASGDNTGFDMNLTVRNCDIENAFRGIWINDAVGRLLVDSCRFTAQDNHTYDGVYKASASGRMTIIVRDCTFIGSTSANNFARRAVHMFSVQNIELLVDGCVFRDFGDSTNNNGIAGVAVRGSTSTGTAFVTNCTFDNFNGDAATNCCRFEGNYTGATFFPGLRAHVTDCNITNYICTDADEAAILFYEVNDCVANGNTMTFGNATGVASGIRFDGCADCTSNDNKMYELYGRGIQHRRIAAAVTNQYSFNCCGNYIHARDVQIGIYTESIARTAVISNNNLHMPDQTAIAVIGTGLAAPAASRKASIVGNSIHCWNTGNTGSAVFVDEIETVVIGDNTVDWGAPVNNFILYARTADTAIINGNIVNNAPPSGTGINIQANASVTTCIMTSNISSDNIATPSFVNGATNATSANNV